MVSKIPIFDIYKLFLNIAYIKKKIEFKPMQELVIQYNGNFSQIR